MKSDVEVVGTHGYGSCTISTHKETIEEKKEKFYRSYLMKKNGF